jgi:hypothetical protein
VRLTGGWRWCELMNPIRWGKVPEPITDLSHEVDRERVSRGRLSFASLSRGILLLRVAQQVPATVLACSGRLAQ